jgi:hypothetical protein
MGRLIQLQQSHYFPKPLDYAPVPKSVMGSGYIRRLLNSGTMTSRSLIPQVAWEKYICTTRGVRWHPCGAWRVQFCRRNYEQNYHVGVDCYFYARVHGFHRAKELAIAYRARLEKEWEEAEQGWATIDATRQKRRDDFEKEKQLIAELEAQQQSQSTSNARL